MKARNIKEFAITFILQYRIIFITLKHVLSFFPWLNNKYLNKIWLLIDFSILRESFLEQYITAHYAEESLKLKKFYNIGAGGQRSTFPFWSYIDLASSKYSKEKIDLFHDLESLQPLPIKSDYAEVIFSSYVMEHISVEAVKNICREAYRCLQSGGIFHSKVHCYAYSYRLLRKRIFPNNHIFGCRETITIIKNFLSTHNFKVKAYFKNPYEYRIESLNNSKQFITFTPEDVFLFHNATAAIDNIKQSSTSVENFLQKKLDHTTLHTFYNDLKTYVDDTKKEAHQHNADYLSQEELYDYIKGLGFTEVYFNQVYQSLSPALWENCFNGHANGFNFTIEAVK